MKSTTRILMGIAMMGGGLYGLSLDIGINGHYFGTGTVFGIGLTLLASGVYDKVNSAKTEK